MHRPGRPNRGAVPRNMVSPAGPYGLPVASSTMVAEAVRKVSSLKQKQLASASASRERTSFSCPPACGRKESKAKLSGKGSRKERGVVFDVFEKWKNQTIRRNAPKGEDLKKIRETIRGIKNQDVTVQEFVGLVAPYTGDTGQVLRTVMAEELATFRKLARNVYETMAQDVGDVLANEHIQLTQFHQERIQLLTDKVTAEVDEIFEMCPTFDFDRYNMYGEDYLIQKFPITLDVFRDDADIELQNRQMAYHRMQWLKSEGERLNEENRRLKHRLNELKNLQQKEQEQALVAEQMAEQKKAYLEKEQQTLQEKLEELSQTLERTMVIHEKLMREDLDQPIKNVTRKALREKKHLRQSEAENWNIKRAIEIEEERTKQAIQSEVIHLILQEDLDEKTQICDNESRKRKRFFRPRRPKKPSAFHFAPIKTPPLVVMEYSSDTQQRPYSAPADFTCIAPCDPCDKRRSPSRKQRTTVIEATTKVTQARGIHNSETAIMPHEIEAGKPKHCGPDDSCPCFY